MKTISAEHSDISTRATPRSPQRYCKLSQVRICSGSNSSHPYSKDYNSCIEEARSDLRRNARPELKAMPESLDKYDTIYLGFPNYWGTMPMAVFTFLERSDLKGKTIKPFCTNEGSGMGESEKVIKVLCPESTIEKGLSIWGSKAANSEKALKKWL